MGEFKVILSDRAKKDLLIIERSGDKASIKKIENIISELYIHPETGTEKTRATKIWTGRLLVETHQ